jgi:hypothetical protein
MATRKTPRRTLHPSAVLRQRDSVAREAAYRGFVADLALLLDPPQPVPK